ncbi:MAG: hypothetical protein ACTSVD_10210 [Candidatus Thorarchaeota archaeon]
MPDSEDKDTVDSKKLSERDKREIQEGACINCVVLTFIMIVLSLAAYLL